MSIRLATPHDAPAIRTVYRAAFPEAEWEQVASLALSLLTPSDAPQTLSVVAEEAGILTGHVAFSPITAPNHPAWTGAILAPLAVDPAHQKKGIGSALVRHGVQHHREAGTDVLFVYGDPAYYGRFGFTTDSAERYTPPHPLAFPFGWQGLALTPQPTDQCPTPISCVAPLDDPSLW